MQVLFHQIIVEEAKEPMIAKASEHDRQECLKSTITLLPAATGRSRAPGAGPRSLPGPVLRPPTDRSRAPTSSEFGRPTRHPLTITDPARP